MVTEVLQLSWHYYGDSGADNSSGDGKRKVMTITMKAAKAMLMALVTVMKMVVARIVPPSIRCPTVSPSFMTFPFSYH